MACLIANRSRWWPNGRVPVEIDWSEVNSSGTVDQSDDNYGLNEPARRDLCKYDYGPIMHYGKGLMKKHDGPSIGQRSHLSYSDRAAASYMFGVLSVRDALLGRGEPPGAGVVHLLDPGESVREWIVCYGLFAKAGGP